MPYFRKLKKAVKSTYMCLRYPFLYPRNRWTGKHYNNWKLHQYHVDNYKDAIGCIFLHTYNEKGLENKDSLSHNVKNADGTTFSSVIDKDKGMITILRNDKKIKAFKISELIGTDEYKMPRVLFKCSNNDPSCYVVFPYDTEIKSESRLHICNYTKDWRLRFKIWGADFINDYVLQLFHCIPTYTEWGAMEELTGWNKAFGKQLLKDMRKQLVKDKMLYRFRITDIKEKYASLRIYTGPATNEMFELLNRYETLSYHTCIECGMPAKYISNGHECPYCKEHIGNRRILAEFDEKGKMHYIEEEEDESN